MSAIYNLHKRHGQFSGFSESSMLLGKSSHIFGPRGDIFLSHNKQILYFLFQMLNFF